VRWGALLAALVLPAAGVSCGAPREPADDATRAQGRDSAGVWVVENSRPLAPAWRVESTPVFTVGWGPDDPDFTWIQSGRILPGGGALIGESSSGILYRLASDGSVLDTWGRKGEGPGEYQRFDAIVSSGDSAFVSDGRLRRVTVLSATGDVLATRPLPGAGRHQVSSILLDGRMLLVPRSGYGSVSEIRPDWVFQTQPILATAFGTSATDTLADLPHLRRWYGLRGGGPGPISVKGRAGGSPDGFAWARSDRPEVRWYDGSGRLLQISRWDEDPELLSAERKSLMTQIFREELSVRGVDEARATAQLERLDDGLDRYDGPMPYWNSLLVDRAGNVWLNEYPQTLVKASERWRVVTRAGTYLAWIELPGVIAVLDVTEDRVLAVRLDEWEVPAVVLLDLTKPTE
jgi:hypothetical protein